MTDEQTALWRMRRIRRRWRSLWLLTMWAVVEAAYVVCALYLAEDIQ